VHLVHEDEAFGTHGMLNALQVGSHSIFLVTGAEARVQGVERGGAHAASTRENGMGQISVLGKLWKLEVGDLEGVVGLACKRRLGEGAWHKGAFG